MTNVDLTTMSTENAAWHVSRNYDYDRDGFAVSPGPLLDAGFVAEIRDHAERVLRCEYETGIAPYTNSGAPDVAEHGPFITATYPQDADRTLQRAIADPRLGEWAAEVLRARRVKVWNCQVMKKYPRSNEKTVVGWHQDEWYGSKLLHGLYNNYWIALDEVDWETGPVRYVCGSHRWSKVFSTRFYDHDTQAQRREIQIPEGEVWEEVEVPLPAGWATLHHQRTIHGSAMCRGSRPRLSLVLSIVKDNFEMVPDCYYAGRVDDPVACPVIFGG